MNITDLFFMIVADAFWSALAAVGFAVLFSVPRRALAGCAVGAAAGHALRTLLIQSGMDIFGATLIGATVIGFLGMVFAQRWSVPAPVFTISAAITMVPGTFAFRTMIGVLALASAAPGDGGQILTEAAVNGIRTGLILAAIAAGIAAPSLLLYRTKPVV